MEKLATDPRPDRLKRMPSTAACRMRRSLVNCWSEPMPAPVRTMATRSPGSIWRSMNSCRVVRTLARLSKLSPRSSTTTAIVRRTAWGRAGWTRGSVVASPFGESLAGVMYVQLLIACFRPSSSISKSEAWRSVT